MKITFENGTPTVDAQDLGSLLELSPQTVQQAMRDGKITSRFEIGVDVDAGRIRLTFFYGNLRVRLTCTDTGEVLSTSRVTIGEK